VPTSCDWRRVKGSNWRFQKCFRKPEQLD